MQAFRPNILLLFFTIFATKCIDAQEYIDSTYNSQEKFRIGTFIKYNKKENLCEFYENDTLRLKIIGTINQFNSWTVERILEERHYLNGNLKRTGYFLVIKTKYLLWQTPINSHIYYRKNGKIKSISAFTNYGVPLYDSLFHKNGAIAKALWYNQ